MFGLILFVAILLYVMIAVRVFHVCCKVFNSNDYALYPVYLSAMWPIGLPLIVIFA